MHVDNVGAILLSDNTYVYQHKNNIDMCHHFICDYVEDRTVEIPIVHSEENLEYPFTNNLIKDCLNLSHQGTYNFSKIRKIHY